MRDPKRCTTTLLQIIPQNKVLETRHHKRKKGRSLQESRKPFTRSELTSGKKYISVDGNWKVIEVRNLVIVMKQKNQSMSNDFDKQKCLTLGVNVYIFY